MIANRYRNGLCVEKNNRYIHGLKIYKRIHRIDLPHTIDNEFQLEFICEYIPNLMVLDSRNYKKPLSRFKRSRLTYPDIFKKRKKNKVIYKKRRYH